MALAMSVVGLFGSIGGAGGRYGEQRFLAAKNAKHAAWQAALWQGMAIPRWVVTGGLAFLAYTVFKEQTVEVVKVVGDKVIYSDPNAIYPLYVQSDLLVPGLRGLIIATLAASYMSAFSSEVNAAASIFVHDIFQPLFERDNEKAQGKHVRQLCRHRDDRLSPRWAAATCSPSTARSTACGRGCSAG